MRLLNVFGNNAQEHHIVVVLQADNAFWSRWRGKVLIGSYVERLDAGELSKPARCPWVRAKEGEQEPRVRLIFDSALDEVDRVKLEQPLSGFATSLQRRRLHKQLRKQFPQASVNDLPAYAAPDFLSIVHPVIPKQWEDWLIRLQRQGVCISHVVSSLDLLCYCSTDSVGLRGAMGRKKSLNEQGPVLFNVSVGKERRHLLVDNGVPLFMRLTANADELNAEALDEQLSASLEHIRTNILQSKRNPLVIAPTFSNSELDEKYQATTVLAALCLEVAIDLELSQLNESMPVPGDVNSLVKGSDAQQRRFGEWLVVPRWLRRTVHQCVRRSTQDQRWRLLGRRAFIGDILKESVQKNQLQQRIRQLQKATLMCAWMSAATVVVASAHGMGSARDRARLMDEHKRVSLQINQLEGHVSSLYRAPELAARTVERLESHAGSQPVQPREIMTTVATAISDYPELQLDSLSWSVLDDNHPLDAVFTAAEQVPVREKIWGAESRAADVQVEIGGTVNSDAGLRERQQTLDSFVSHLESIQGVTSVIVLESPVNAARSSERSRRDTSVYRLTLKLGAY